MGSLFWDITLCTDEHSKISVAIMYDIVSSASADSLAFGARTSADMVMTVENMKCNYILWNPVN